MFYFGELAALILCWFFYGELHWMVERRVVKVCRKKLVEERCKTLADRLFFTPVSVRARLGTLYYINKGAFCLLAFFTACLSDDSIILFLSDWGKLLLLSAVIPTVFAVMSIGKLRRKGA